MDVAFVFPGQGAQAVGMGLAFYESSAEAKAIFDQADLVVDGLTDVIFNGPQEKLTTTAFCQPAIFTCSVAAMEALKAHPMYGDINPRFACGLSLGEYSALTATGALDFAKTLQLVQARSSLMEKATQLREGKMAAVIGFDKAQLITICQETGAEVANFNSPDQIVITGEAAAVVAASQKLEEAGAKRVIPLDVSGAFHSSLMQSAQDQFSEVLEDVELTDPELPIVSNVDALPTQNTDHITLNLAKQITSSVQWVATIEAMMAEGVSTFIEITPGTVLKGLIRKINRDLTVFNIQKPEDMAKIFD